MGEPGSTGDRMLVGRLLAGIRAIERTGAHSVSVEYYDIQVRQLNRPDEHEVPQPKRRISVEWVARAEWLEAEPSGGPEAEHVMRTITSQAYPYGAMAIEDLLARVINGGTCARCGRTTIWQLTTLGADRPEQDYCNMILTTGDLDNDQEYLYRRTCEGGV